MIKETLFRTILVDDEPLAIQRLEKMLKPHSAAIKIIAKATGGKEAIELIEFLKPDLVFLDIQMPEINGFDVLGRLKHQPLIIFATAYDKYALEAFEANSIDYLMKPIDSERLNRAIEKLKKLTSEQSVDLYKKLEEIIPRIGTPKTKWIQVRKGDRINLLNPADICFFTADEKYVRVHTFNNEYLITTTLSTLEKDLGDDFVRIHRASLINMRFIDEIFKMFKGNYKVRMKDQKKTELIISRQSRNKLGLA